VQGFGLWSGQAVTEMQANNTLSLIESVPLIVAVTRQLTNNRGNLEEKAVLGKLKQSVESSGNS